MLAHYLDCHPSEVELQTAANGKPQLPDGAPVRFNLSHTDGLCLIIVAHELEVGIDVEWIRPAAETEGLAPLIYSARETARVARLGADRRNEHLLRTWVMKEAYLKATGTGLRVNPATLDAAALPVLEFEPAAGFLAAAATLSVPPAECRLEWHDFFPGWAHTQNQYGFQAAPHGASALAA